MTDPDRNTTADALTNFDPDWMTADGRRLMVPVETCADAARLLRTHDTPTDSDTAARARRLLNNDIAWDDDFIAAVLTDLMAERDAAVARADTLAAAITEYLDPTCARGPSHLRDAIRGTDR